MENAKVRALSITDLGLADMQKILKFEREQYITIESYFKIINHAKDVKEFIKEIFEAIDCLNEREETNPNKIKLKDIFRNICTLENDLYIGMGKFVISPDNLWSNTYDSLMYVVYNLRYIIESLFNLEKIFNEKEAKGGK